MRRGTLGGKPEGKQSGGAQMKVLKRNKLPSKRGFILKHERSTRTHQSISAQ